MTGLPSSSGPRTVHALGPAGTIEDWLVSPVWEHPCAELGEVVAADGSPWDAEGRPGRWRLTQGPDAAVVKAALYQLHPLVEGAERPVLVEGGPLAWPSPFPDGGQLVGHWTRHHTAGDGVIERSTFCYTPTYRTFVAGTRLELDQPEVRRLEVSSTGPAQVWLDGRLILEHAEFGYMQPWTRGVDVLMPSGTSDLVVASWNVALREVRQTVTVRVVGLPVRVTLPAPGADEQRDAEAQRLLSGVSVRQWEAADGSGVLHGPPGLRIRVTAGEVPVGSVTFDDAGRAVVPLVPSQADHEQASMLATGEIALRVQVDDDACPSTRTLLVGHLPWRTRQAPRGAPADWRRELLEHVAGRSGSARCLSVHALDPEGDDIVVTRAALEVPLRFIATRCDCADFEAVGLMLLWHRVPEPRWEPQARAAVRSALLGFKYWIDQPGCDAMCYFTENHQMVWHTAETLVGEAFADEVFTNTGWTGAQHAAHGREMARAWVRRKLTSGFSEFDSNAYLAIDALALVALMDHADDDSLRRSAEALLDKILLTLAANSWRGVHASAHGRSYAPTLRASCLEETAPIMWLAWGVGALNEATLPATALATSPAYRVPDVVSAIGATADEDWAGSQYYEGEYAFERDLLVRPYASHVVVHRGPGGMVASVQDYRAGLPGLQEHVWGITLPDQVQVWATNPAATTHGSHTRPSAWVGHRVLPRVRQHHRTVIALHRFAPGPPVLHLWFPCDRFDEWERHGDWLLGRKGSGLVAVAAPGGWEPDRSGDEAWQRWRPGVAGPLVARHEDTRTAPDVAALRERLPQVSWDTAAPGVEVRQPGEACLALDWDGPFLVDGKPQGLRDGVPARPLHLQNPACTVSEPAGLVEVVWGGHAMRLDPLAGRRLEPPSGVDRPAVADRPSVPGRV